jgi:hypothetical protein
MGQRRPRAKQQGYRKPCVPGRKLSQDFFLGAGRGTGRRAQGIERVRRQGEPGGARPRESIPYGSTIVVSPSGYSMPDLTVASGRWREPDGQIHAELGDLIPMQAAVLSRPIADIMRTIGASEFQATLLILQSYGASDAYKTTYLH